MPHATRYEVFSGDRLILTVSDEPGALISALAPPPPPDRPLPQHPFLSAVAYVPALEGELRQMLDESSSTADFLDRLSTAGYRIELAT